MTIGEEGHIQRVTDASIVGEHRGTERDATLPTVDVVICTYSATRETFLRRAIASVAAQDQAARIIVVVDHAGELYRTLSCDPSLGARIEVYENAYEQGLSGARNTGLDRSTSVVVAFLDDDARADAGWIETMRRAHTDPDVLATGGWVTPDWEDGDRPAWLPEEFWWTIGCSYRGLPAGRMPEIRNPIGANMSFRRSLLADVGGFRSGLGRIGTTPLGCEETEAAIRVRAFAPWGKIVQLPGARVRHFVPHSRTTWSYFRDRCLAEGRSKAATTDLVGMDDGLSSERRYVLRTLPGGVLRGLYDAGRGDLMGAYRSGAIAAGVSLTAFGYLAGRRQIRMKRDRSLAGPATSNTNGETPIGPIAMLIVDLDEAGDGRELTVPRPSRSPDGLVPEMTLVLVRWHGDPIAYLRRPAPGGRLNLDELRAHDAVRRGRAKHEAAMGCAQSVGVGDDARCRDRAYALLDDMGDHSPSVTVAIPTIGRLDSLAETLDGVRALEYQGLEILVVDNRPSNPETRAFVDACQKMDPRVRYAAELRPGSSAPRNRALTEAQGEIICFLDDDVLIDEDWLRALVTPLVRDPTVGATTGLVLSRDLETRAQYLLEAYGGFGKGLSERRFDLGTDRPRGVFCYPYWGGAFGTGANMAIRRDLALNLGGFDLSLGTGSPGLAGDDVDMLSRVVLGGAALVYSPRAICRHQHNRTDAAFGRQLWTYGVGLGNQMIKGLVGDPKFLPALVRSLVEMRSARAEHRDGESNWGPRPLPALRRRLRVRENAGKLAAPVYYLRAARYARRDGFLGHLPPSRPRSRLGRK